MKKNYVKPSVKVRKIDMESLLTSQSNQINSLTPVSDLDNAPGNGGNSNGMLSVGASQNLWSEDEEE